MSGKIITAVAAAVLLASTGLASAQTRASRYDRAPNGYANDYYDVAPNQFPDAAPNWNDGSYPFPVTGQSGA